MLVTLVPVGGHLTALVDIRAGFPTQTEPGLADVEHQEIGLVEGMGVGDVLQLPDSTQHLLPSQSQGIMECSILTDIHMHTVRDLKITYYMWGIPFTLHTRTPQA